MGDRLLPEDLCPPGLVGLGQKVEIFGRSPLPVPVGTRVPSCPPAGEPEAGFFVTGLVGSSSELSWWPLFELAVINSISFSSVNTADISGGADPVFKFADSFLCSVVGTGMVISFVWAAELVVGVLFWLDFCSLIASSLFSRDSMVCVSHYSSDLKLFGGVMLFTHWWGFETVAYEFFSWINHSSFNSLSGFRERYVVFIFFFDDFLFC